MSNFNEFQAWVENMGQSPIESIRCFNRIEIVYGNIQNHYLKDKCKFLLEEFSYTKKDLNNGKKRHKFVFSSKKGIVSDESYIKQSSQFKSHIKRYIKFMEYREKF